jgi:hypothetical protein
MSRQSTRSFTTSTPSDFHSSSVASRRWPFAPMSWASSCRIVIWLRLADAGVAVAQNAHAATASSSIRRLGGVKAIGLQVGRGERSCVRERRALRPQRPRSDQGP